MIPSHNLPRPLRLRGILAHSYEGKTGNDCRTCYHLRTEPSDDGFGTTVIEVPTATTRKKYRLEDQ